MDRPQDVSTPDGEAWPADAIEIGRIGEAWGIKGGFRVLPHASEPEALFSSKRWFLKEPEFRPRPPGSPPLPTLLRIVQAREHGDGIVASAHDVEDRNAAEALRGARIFVSRSSFPSAAEDEFYWVDLIGLQVVNREGVVLGQVADLLDTGAHSVLRVQPAAVEGEPAPAERLIPFVAAYIDAVERELGRIRVDWGLDY